jgi:hypothetical protein
MYGRALGGMLCLVALLAFGTSLCVPSAQAASASRSAAQTGGFQRPKSDLAPCTKPLYAPNRTCESTSPTVDRWWSSTAADTHCTYRLHVDWNDGTSSSRTFVDPAKGIHLIATHDYKGYTTYTEVTTSTVLAGNCQPVPRTTFLITHMPNSLPSFLEALGIQPSCYKDFIPDPADLGLKEIDLGDTLGLYKIGKRLGALFKVVDDAGLVYLVLFELPFDCAVTTESVREEPSGSTVPGILGPLPRAYAYGASHPGKLFKPSGHVPPRPVITAIGGYQAGGLVYFSIFYTNPGKDAKGFGFVGINGAGWAQENHPFSSPSYGVVRHDEISYPFNLGCGTRHQYSSSVAAWIYNKAGVRSQPVQITLTCNG